MIKDIKNPIPQGKYVPATRSGQTIYTAGMTPRDDGKLVMEGRVLCSEPLQTYQPAVIVAARNVLAAAVNMLKPGEKIDQILLMSVYVNAEDGFEKHARIADFASEFLYQELGTCAIGSRVSVGIASLPSNAPVEIQLTVAVK
jgi:enamine deaminase RidA (YjgF/YER057c/UK114 family)